MTFTTTQIVALVAAVAVKQALGFAWFSPVLFGRALAAASGLSVDEMERRARRHLFADAALALLTAAALTFAVTVSGATDWFYGLLIGLAAWACFAMPVSAATCFYEGRSAKLLGLQNGYLVVTYAAMGAIVGGGA